MSHAAKLKGLKQNEINRSDFGLHTVKYVYAS